MVSLVGMALGFVMIWGLHFTSLKMEQSDNRRTMALEIAGRNLELLRTTNTTNTGTNPLSMNCTDATGFASPPFPPASTCTANIQWDPANSWRRTATVTVAWPERAKAGLGGSSSPTVTQTVQMTAVYGDHLTP